MNERMFRPRRRLRNELAPLVFVLLIAGAIVSVFPFTAVSTPPASVDPRVVASCTFVELDADYEAKALAAARAAWQLHGQDVSRERTELLLKELPVAPPAEMIGLDARKRDAEPPALPYVPESTISSVAAPAPAQLPPWTGADDPLPFPKEELLKLK